jgi:hypothetical protein
MFEPEPGDPAGADYEQDLALWYDRQIALLRARRFGELDVENLIQELEYFVGKDRRELASRLRALLMHLLKCQFQPQRISRGWLGTIAEQRAGIEALLEDSPSLGPGLMQVANKMYPKAVHAAAIETRMASGTFPPVNPYTRDQLLDIA